MIEMFFVLSWYLMQLAFIYKGSYGTCIEM